MQKIGSNRDAVGVFGYSYLEENMDSLNGLSMNGVEPTYANIASFSYPGARPLYVYVKNAHLDAIPGLQEFLNLWTESWGRDGPLAKVGLVANPDDVMARMTAAVKDHTALTADELK